jgi:hypothetical protein
LIGEIGLADTLVIAGAAGGEEEKKANRDQTNHAMPLAACRPKGLTMTQQRTESRGEHRKPLSPGESDDPL